MKNAFTILLCSVIALLLAFPATLDAQTNCPAPTSTTVSNITSSGAELGWTTTLLASHFNLQYRPLGTPTWVQITVQQVPFTLTNLPCATGFEWQVQAVCSNTGTGGISTFTPGPVFTTLPCNNACLAPTSLTASNITATGAVLTWTALAPAPNTYNLRYRPVSAPNFTVINNVGSLYQLGGLTCNTPYEWQVQSICLSSSGITSLSPWSAPAFFTTAACQNVCPPPTGLSVTNVTATGAVLSWTASGSSPGTTYNIQYQAAGSTNWTTINNVSGTLFQLGGLTCNTAYIFQVQAVCVNTVNNTTTLSPWSSMFTFVTAACSNACPAPTGLTITNISATGAVLSWASTSPTPNTTYIIQYQTSPNGSWVTINNVTSNMYQLGGLTCNTTYIFRVQTVCYTTAGISTLSPWSQPFTFTTLQCPTNCFPPTGLISSNITSNGAVLSWTTSVPAPVMYNLRYKVVSAINWIVINNVSSPHQLGNLGCNANYEWQVQSVCASTTGTATLSSWSPSAYFSTATCPTTCPPPTGLSTTNITTFSALASWSAVPGAAGYQIRYRPVGTLAWIFVSSAATSFNLTNLACGVQYEWQVRAYCYPVLNSTANPFSPIATFTTLTCPVTCPPPTGLTVSNITTTSAELYWNSTSAPAYRVRYRIAATGTLWNLQITSATTLSISNLMAGALYEWQVQSICSPSTNLGGSIWSALSTFQTLPGGNTLCAAPTGLTATGVSQQGALLTWNAVAGAQAYNIRYRPINNTPNYITGTATTNLFQVGNLLPGTVYEWQVQSICVGTNGTTSLSPWSTTSVFTTPVLLTLYPNPADKVSTLSYFSNESAKMVVEVRDLFGKVVYSGMFAVSEGNNELELPTNKFHEGLYSVTINSHNSYQGTARLLIKR